MDQQLSLSELLRDSPLNWGKWGPDDEVGSLNYLDESTILSALQSVRQGKTFTLQTPIGRPGGDPIFPGRSQSQHYMAMDKGFYLAGKNEPYAGGLEFADDYIAMFLQGSTQYDALGHVWYDDLLWNGYDARTTIGGLSRASILPIAERGVVGRAVILDIARFRGKDHLESGETITHMDLEACAAHQGCEIRKRDIIIVRTGWLEQFYALGADAFYGEEYCEPGLTYSPELVDWFADHEIPNLVTDTLANEVTVDPNSGIKIPLHAALMRNLGIALTEAAWLKDLAADSAADKQFDCLYIAAPLKVVEGTGAPVNPVVIK